MLKKILIALVVTLISTTSEAGVLAKAQQYVGLHESRNNKTLKKVLGVDPSRTPWCGYFLGMVVRTTGKKPPKNYSFARSWVSYGMAVPIKRARPGDVVVVRTGRGYHVGVMQSLTSQGVNLVGGNQSNRVQKSTFPRKAIVAIRR